MPQEGEGRGLQRFGSGSGSGKERTGISQKYMKISLLSETLCGCPQIYLSLQYNFRFGWSTINRLIPEVCDAIIRFNQDEVVDCSNRKDILSYTLWFLRYSLDQFFKVKVTLARSNLKSRFHSDNADQCPQPI